MPVKSTAITVHYFAEDVSAGGGKTGDSANHTLRVVADGTASVIAASPAEVDATNLPGLYKVAISAGENGGNIMYVGGKSSTANVVIRGVQWTNEVNAAAFSGDAVAADNAESFFDGTGYAGTGNTIPNVTTVATTTNLTNLPTIPANWLTAAGLASDAVTEIRSIASGTSDSGTTTTMVDAARTESDTDYWKGALIVFTSGTITGQSRVITAFNPATDTITFAPATTAAVSTQTYEIWPTGDFLRPTTSGLTLDVSGAGLTAVPWNAAWDAEVQSEVDDAIIAKGLDHLVFTSVAGTDVADDSIVAKLVSKSAVADWDTFVNTTDALEAIRDRGDAAWITATGFSTHSAADVWTAATRTLTAATNITSTGGTITVSAGALILTAAERDSIATAALKLDWTGITGEAGRSILNALRKLRNEWSISGTTLTIKKEDDLTTAYTQTLTATAGANPITAIDN